MAGTWGNQARFTAQMSWRKKVWEGRSASERPKDMFSCCDYRSPCCPIQGPRRLQAGEQSGFLLCAFSRSAGSVCFISRNERCNLAKDEKEVAWRRVAKERKKKVREKEERRHPDYSRLLSFLFFDLAWTRSATKASCPLAAVSQGPGFASDVRPSITSLLSYYFFASWLSWLIIFYLSAFPFLFFPSFLLWSLLLFPLRLSSLIFFTCFSFLGPLVLLIRPEPTSSANWQT